MINGISSFMFLRAGLVDDSSWGFGIFLLYLDINRLCFYYVNDLNEMRLDLYELLKVIERVIY